MRKSIPKLFVEEPGRSIVYLGSLILLRAGMQVALYQKGFISVSADEFARGIRAATWADAPQLNILSDVQGIWLPIEKYLNGLMLLIWPDVIVAPRVTVFVASCLLLAAVYLLAYHLFDGFRVALLSTLIISFQPWFVWLSGTPMLEMYYLACFFAGLFFIIMWLKESRKGYWFWAGICFLLASGFHVQSWTYVNIVNLLTLPVLFRFARQKDYTNISKLIAYYVLSNGLIISFALIEFIYTGTIFAFIVNHTSYSRWFYGGYDVSIPNKLLYYPEIILKQTSAIVWICLFVALAFLGRDKERRWKLFPLLLAILALLFNSFMNAFSGPPSAAPPRYSLFYIIILSFYLAYGIYHLFMLGWQHSHQLIKISSIALATILLLSVIGWGAIRIPNYPHGVSNDAVEVGRNLNKLLNKNPGSYMVELRYWDYLAIDLTSRHFDKITFDREQDVRDRNTPSIFLQDRYYICNELAIPDLRYVVLKDADLKSRAQHIDILKQKESVGSWTIYEVLPESNLAGESCIVK